MHTLLPQPNGCFLHWNISEVPEVTALWCFWLKRGKGRAHRDWWILRGTSTSVFVFKEKSAWKHLKTWKIHFNIFLVKYYLIGSYFTIIKKLFQIASKHPKYSLKYFWLIWNSLRKLRALPCKQTTSPTTLLMWAEVM